MVLGKSIHPSSIHSYTCISIKRKHAINVINWLIQLMGISVSVVLFYQSFCRFENFFNIKKKNSLIPKPLTLQQNPRDAEGQSVLLNSFRSELLQGRQSHSRTRL